MRAAVPTGTSALLEVSRTEGELKQKLRICSVRKSYGPVTALADANLEMRQGEFVTLLGPSGSGKTTLLMIVAGLISPDAGEVWIDGQLATHTPSFKRGLGLVFQNYALFPHLTVFDNIAFPLRMRKTHEAAITKAVREVLELVRLPDVGHRLPGALSGGQQQRIALARCVVYKPSIILMDEPLGALDRKLRDQMQLEIKSLHRQLGITALYVTHDQDEAMIMSDRICLMNEGRIEQVGSATELYFGPRSVFAASFLGDSNIFEAMVEGREDDTLLLGGVAGVTVRAPARPGLRNGSTVKFMVRPECLSVLGPRETADNVVDGILRDVILVGGLTKFYVHLLDGQLVSATRLTAGPMLPEMPGARLRLGWSVASTVLLADGPGTHE